MDKINWKQKLSSRKFWAAVAAWLTANGAAFGLTEGITAKIVLIVTGIGALCVYMLAEGWTDANRAEKDIGNNDNDTPREP
ncbi:hypothetical protein FACS18949_15230 [Clostridia bacterium]|nr:hypothetical protein FACS189425_08750 [Clostridia bacterium]GHV36164.1 hypothetical protein FACS18949_15230 [Clostridia bacterium]